MRVRSALATLALTATAVAGGTAVAAADGVDPMIGALLTSKSSTASDVKLGRIGPEDSIIGKLMKPGAVTDATNHEAVSSTSSTVLPTSDAKMGTILGSSVDSTTSKLVKPGAATDVTSQATGSLG